MITAKLTPGLGNQLFIIATGYALAKRNNDKFVLHNQEWTYNDSFKTKIERSKGFVPEETWTEQGFPYTEIPYKKNTLISGYFQSEKYFIDQKDEIIKLFEPVNEIKTKIRASMDIVNDKNTVSIHVRRGDYLTLPNHHPVCTMDYYNEAISQFDKNSIFIVCSDDIEWCRENFKGNNFIFSKNDEIMDLFIQVKCKHNIIANSTFHWWGAWMNNAPDKKVIAPKKWFGIAYENWDTKDLLPEGWITL